MSYESHFNGLLNEFNLELKQCKLFYEDLDQTNRKFINEQNLDEFEDEYDKIQMEAIIKDLERQEKENVKDYQESLIYLRNLFFRNILELRERFS